MNNIDDAMSELNALLEAAKQANPCKLTHEFMRPATLAAQQAGMLACVRCKMLMDKDEVKKIGQRIQGRGSFIVDAEMQPMGEVLEDVATEPL